MYYDWGCKPNDMPYHQWEQQRVDDLKGWIAKLRHYQSDPTSEKPERKLGEQGHVYIACCGPPVDAYKIGHSGNPLGRMSKLKSTLKKQLGCDDINFVKAYRPFLSRELLEAALHNHFNHCRRARQGRHRHGLATELFDLSQAEVDDFKTTAKAVEWNLLPVEILRLETLLRHCEAELHKA